MLFGWKDFTTELCHYTVKVVVENICQLFGKIYNILYSKL